MDNLRQQFKEIYDQYIDKIYRFIYLKVNSEETAQDICSETFSKGWQKFQNGKIDNLSAFLFRIARNLVVDFYRQKGKYQVVSAEHCQEAQDPQPGPEEKAILNSDMVEVKQALNNIKKDYQDVIIYRYLDELSIQEISQILNKPENTVRVMLHRGLRTLRNKLA